MRHDTIIDAHLHLDERCGSAIDAARELDSQLASAGIKRAIVLHLLAQPWPVTEVAKAIASSSRLVGFVNVHPYEPSAIDDLKRGVELGFIGVKLHPRLQRFSIEDSRTIDLILTAGQLGLPVLIDCFPDGDWLMDGFDPVNFARLAKQCPDTRIILAHFGGHHCIDFMMLGKRIPNVYFDCSYSLLYYRGSPIVQALTYCFKSMRFNRVFYGSDYPDRSIGDSLRGSLREFAHAGIEGHDLKKLLSQNIIDFFGWADIA